MGFTRRKFKNKVNTGLIKTKKAQIIFLKNLSYRLSKAQKLQAIRIKLLHLGF